MWDEEAERDGSGGGDWHDYEWTFTDVKPKGRAPEATWTGTYRQMRWMLDDGLNKELVKLWKSARYERHQKALNGKKEARGYIKGGSDAWKKRKVQPCWQTGPAAAAAASSADDGSTVTKQRRMTGSSTAAVSRVAQKFAEVVDLMPTDRKTVSAGFDRYLNTYENAAQLAQSERIVTAQEKQVLTTFIKGMEELNTVCARGAHLVSGSDRLATRITACNIFELGRQAQKDAGDKATASLNLLQQKLHLHPRMQKEAAERLDGVFADKTKKIAMNLWRKRKGRRAKWADIEYIIAWLTEHYLIDIPGRTKKVKHQVSNGTGGYDTVVTEMTVCGLRDTYDGIFRAFQRTDRGKTIVNRGGRGIKWTAFTSLIPHHMPWVLPLSKVPRQTCAW